MKKALVSLLETMLIFTVIVAVVMLLLSGIIAHVFK